jgi:cell division protein FtsQ
VVTVLAASAVGGRAAHRWITTTSRFGAHDIQVSGNTRTTRDEILAAAGVQPGTNVLGIDTRRAERAIERLPWIEHAHVVRRLPGLVVVSVEERAPAAIVAAGALYLCTADGMLFKRVQPGDPDDLPIITGIARDEFDRDPDTAREYVRDALALLADVSASSLGARARIEEVHRDPTGDLSLVLADHEVYVWLGRGPYRAKLAHLSAVLTELDRQHLVPAEIHLESDRHPDRATVRLPVPVAAPDPTPAPAPHPAPLPATARSARSASTPPAAPAHATHATRHERAPAPSDARAGSIAHHARRAH